MNCILLFKEGPSAKFLIWNERLCARLCSGNLEMDYFKDPVFKSRMVIQDPAVKTVYYLQFLLKYVFSLLTLFLGFLTVLFSISGLFNSFDENQDGHIDFRELACGISKCCRGPNAERQTCEYTCN